MIDADDSKRARLVSLLWNLKRILQDAPEGTVEGIRYVHFNAMVRDHVYRADVIAKAAACTDPKIAEVAREIQGLDVPESLIQAARRQSLQGEAAHDMAAAADYTLSDGPAAQAQRPPRRDKGIRAGLAILALALVGAALGVIAARYLDVIKDVEVKGSLITDTRWSADRVYHLDGLVFVEGRATLTIEPGTRILGRPGSALIVTRDARIDARGTNEAPIVFTSAKPVGERARGDWGGVVLLGNAPVNTKGSHIEGIDRADPRGGFGGSDADDSCGILQYARIEFAGFEISRDNELNGLTLGGCGSSTVVRNVQVHMGMDDGVEVFGGAVSLSYVVITRAGDDGLDWDRGWTGNAQFIIIQQDGEDGDSGIEADSHKSDPQTTPRSAPIISNLTIISSGNTGIGQRGMVLRTGTAGVLRNTHIGGFTIGAVDVRDAVTVDNIKSGALSFEGLVISDAANDLFEPEIGDKKDDDGGFDEERYFRAKKGVVVTGAKILPPAAFDIGAPNFVPAFEHEVLMTTAVPVPQGEFWDEAANFVGAVRPGNYGSWTDGWTSYPRN